MSAVEHLEQRAEWDRSWHTGDHALLIRPIPVIVRSVDGHWLTVLPESNTPVLVHIDQLRPIRREAP